MKALTLEELTVSVVNDSTKSNIVMVGIDELRNNLHKFETEDLEDSFVWGNGIGEHLREAIAGTFEESDISNVLHFIVDYHEVLAQLDDEAIRVFLADVYPVNVINMIREEGFNPQVCNRVGAMDEDELETLGYPFNRKATLCDIQRDI